MKKASAFFNRLLRPPRWILFSAPPLVFSALALIFINELEDSIPAYVIYGMSVYCLAIIIIPLPKFIRKTKCGIRQVMSRSEFGRKYLDDCAFRACVGIFQGMAIDFFYVAFRIFLGIRYASIWFITMAAYYLMLGIIRLVLAVNYRRRTKVKEAVCYRRTAWLLFALNIPMGAMIALMVITDYGYSYPGYVIYVSAMYSFYTLIVSIINLVKFKKSGSPILSAAKVVNFVAALMSILALQTAMIAQFSDQSDNFRKTMNAITGSGIWLCVITIAVYMLINTKKQKMR